MSTARGCLLSDCVCVLARTRSLEGAPKLLGELAAAAKLTEKAWFATDAEDYATG